MIRVKQKQQQDEDRKPQTPCLAMRVREAAKAVGVSERTLWTWADQGIVPHVRQGKIILFPVKALESWLEQRAQCKQAENSDAEKN